MLRFCRLALFITATMFASLSFTLPAAAEPQGREEVKHWYVNQYLPPMEKKLTWNGSADSCQAGSLGAKKVNTYEAQINAVREFVGLDPIIMRTGSSVQKTALMMHAEGELSHYPGLTWACYDVLGAATAAQSNLALSYSGTMGGALDLYMDEPGSNNKIVGHRRWVLLPEAKVFKVGATSRTQALQVIGVPRRVTYKNPRWVGWPRSGAFPSQLEPDGRWSLSSGNALFRWDSPTVRITRNGVRVKDIRVHTPAYGYGRPTLAWEMPREVTDGTYRVQVFNGTGTARHRVAAYRVDLFTP